MKSNKHLNIAVVGGGPGGLYFSILTKKAFPNANIDVFERNKADDSFGFGVVFSDETLSEFLTRDPESYELIRRHFAYWDDLDVARNGESIRITGNGFCGCSRKTLLQLLHQRCREEGVTLQFDTEVDGLKLSDQYDIVVAADGIASKIRSQLSTAFGTNIQLQKNRFVWLGSSRPLEAFTYFFRSTPKGSFVAHSYQYEEGKSTWVVECCEKTWKAWGFQVENETDSINKLQDIFSEELQGHSFISNKSHWRQFPTITNEKWHNGNIVLLGDAKATAHFSIGSGTKLAMESAIALSDAITNQPNNLSQAFSDYETKRRKRVERIQEAANVSLNWFEQMDRHMQHSFKCFAFGVMTRAKKVTYENLQLRDGQFTDAVLKEFISNNNLDPNSTSPAFTPFKLRSCEIKNRIVMAPMGQYKATDGLVNNWHLVHYSSRATGGAGLIITEMTAIAPEGRIGETCAGIWNTTQVAAWKKITTFIHQNSSCKIAIQLGHAGRKSTVNRQPLSASALAYSDNHPLPKEMDRKDMDDVISLFTEATKNAIDAGFDAVELQAHHGFLLASFLSPLTNNRTDNYGGSIQNRLRFPLEVFDAMRAAFPQQQPLLVAISAEDWVSNGISPEDVLEICSSFKNHGADIIHVSTGLTVAEQKAPINSMWQVPFSDHVRNEAQIPTLVSGGMDEIDQVNTVLLGAKADLVAIGKAYLTDPSFAMRSAAHEGVAIEIAPAYEKGKAPLYKKMQYQRKTQERMKKSLKPESHKIK